MVKRFKMQTDVNYLLSTMFSECLNDRQISSENNYAYKAYIQSILFYPEGSQKNLLSAGLFEKERDTAARKRIFELSDNDEDDILLKPNAKRSKTTKSKFDLDLGCDAQEKKSIPPYSINLGKGVGMELKEFRS
ncbi:hypothetical protein TNCV_2351291 [Trichonephila clavipes]|nr:hypothetical protein TNCV_2351291 [Trichonephila clavipes]